jgi:hypothetical protein
LVTIKCADNLKTENEDIGELGNVCSVNILGAFTVKQHYNNITNTGSTDCRKVCKPIFERMR